MLAFYSLTPPQKTILNLQRDHVFPRKCVLPPFDMHAHTQFASGDASPAASLYSVVALNLTSRFSANILAISF